MADGALKVLFVSAEVAPYSTVGGLAHVASFLTRALKKDGVDARIFTPKYGSIKSNLLKTDLLIEGLEVPTGENASDKPAKLICNVRMLKTPKKFDPEIYFLENMEYYEQRANVYGYMDDHVRFGLLSKAVLEFVKTGHFVPDIIHVNDWHTGYLTNYLKTEYGHEPKLAGVSTVYSIHNLYQGMFDFDHASEMDFDDGKGPLAGFWDERFMKQNGLKRGAMNADLVNTVSQTYSRELMTEEYAPRLHNFFKELRAKFFGVLNGVDYQNFDPKKDKLIKQNFSASSTNLRDENKLDLQREFNLKESLGIPILGVVGRMGEQKGIDLIMETMDFILSETNAQLIAMGTGDDKYRDYFTALEGRFPGRVGTHMLFDAVLPRKIYAGADMLLIPSKYEPGGIVALESLRYGCVPIVRATGGLSDSVVDYDPGENIGTGFSFRTYSGMSFLVAVVRALETYRNKPEWKKIVKRAMSQDFSWTKAAVKYEELYKRARENHGLG